MSIFDDAGEDIDLVAFARRCLAAGRVNGASPHLLFAIAHDQSGVKNIVADEDKPAGPFQFTFAEWAAIAVPLGFGADQRDDPFAQCFVAAKKIADIAAGLQAVLPNKRFATGAELYFAWLIGSAVATEVLNATRMVEGKRSETIEVALHAVVPAAAVILMTGHAALFKSDGTARSVDAVLEEVAKLLDPGLVISVAKIEEAEPGLFAAVDSATDASTTPWMVLAKQQLDFGVQEPSAEIDKYFTQTNLGRGDHGETAWCAAFVSWCIHQSTNPPKPLAYSARAVDWATIGNSVAPAYGAIAVTFPLVDGSSGHIGFVMHADAERIMLLAGNQQPAGGGNGAVCIREFALGKVRTFRMV